METITTGRTAAWRARLACGFIKAPAANVVNIGVLAIAAIGGSSGWASPVSAAEGWQRGDQVRTLVSTPTGFMAGTADGVLLRSQDGQHWHRQSLPNPAALVASATCPNGQVLALDFYHRIWMAEATDTLEASPQWQAHEFDHGFDPLAVHCDPRNRWWVVGSRSTVISSADAGQHWQMDSLGQDAILTGIHFSDVDHGTMVGEFGTVALTQDGGAHWMPQRNALPEDFYPYALGASATQQLWVSGIGGALYRSDDGGVHWQATAPAPAPIFAFVSTANALYAVGAQATVNAWTGTQWQPVEAAKAIGTAADEWFGGAVHGQQLVVAGASGIRRMSLGGVNPTELSQGDMSSAAMSQPANGETTGQPTLAAAAVHGGVQ